MMTIRPAGREDEDAIWRIFHAVVEPGDTYAFPADMTRQEALAMWMAPTAHAYVAADGDDIVGTYLLKANQPGRGSHVSNAAFMVAPSAQGRGVGKQLLDHAIGQAALARRRMPVVELRLSVAEPNGRARRLFTQFGFAFVDGEHGRYDGGQRALHMARPVKP